ncbi:MAG: late competence development ComFB family protein [Treponema sp.]|nr:late competence development ComFB family protein [Treponema sp.]
MAFVDEYDFELLKNESELMILNELESQLAEKGDDICRCNDCVVDMAAMALNAVKPLYRFSLLGSLHAAQAMDDPSFANSIYHAVANAIEKISSNPSHD